VYVIISLLYAFAIQTNIINYQYISDIAFSVTYVDDNLAKPDERDRALRSTVA